MCRITDMRIAGSARKHLRLLRNLCGTTALGSVVLCTLLHHYVGCRRSRDWESTVTGVEPERRLLEASVAGRRAYCMPRRDLRERMAYHCFYACSGPGDYAEAAGRGVRTLRLSETAAGQEVQADLETLLKKHSLEMDQLREEERIAREADLASVCADLEKEKKKKESFESSSAALSQSPTTGGSSESSFGRFLLEHGTDVVDIALTFAQLMKGGSSPASASTTASARPRGRPPKIPMTQVLQVACLVWSRVIWSDRRIWLRCGDQASVRPDLVHLVRSGRVWRIWQISDLHCNGKSVTGVH